MHGTKELSDVSYNTDAVSRFVELQCEISSVTNDSSSVYYNTPSTQNILGRCHEPVEIHNVGCVLVL